MFRYLKAIRVVLAVQWRLVKLLLTGSYGVFMAARTRIKRASLSSKKPLSRRQILFRRYFPAWVMLAGVFAIMLPSILSSTLDLGGRVIGAIPAWIESILNGGSTIAPLFTPEVDYWSRDIKRWADEYQLDPNLLATVIQIESCGHPKVSSYAGAQGLFQVMPYHFASGENTLDPDTNAKRGADVLKLCLSLANGDSSMAMACYNGGPSVLGLPFGAWTPETQRYYVWGRGIYGDAVNHASYSETLQQWLDAGGSFLCNRADAELGIN